MFLLIQVKKVQEKSEIITRGWYMGQIDCLNKISNHIHNNEHKTISKNIKYTECKF